MDRLNILVLHGLGDPALAQAFLVKHVFSLQRNFPLHNYVYHDAALPMPQYVIDAEFDAILLDVTFLTARWAGERFFHSRLQEYSFVASSAAIKIAFPQDEYDCHELLDNWMCAWRVDVVYSVISSGWEVLYPNYHKTGDIRLGYTGYIDESLIDRPYKAFGNRDIDIGYRAKRLPPYFGRIGENKWTIGRDVALIANKLGFKVDISLGDVGTLFGHAWYDFIENSKFTLGANSGSSLLDPRGDIQRRVMEYLREHPSATFDEVEAHVFPGLDGYPMTAISPRVLEAALLGSAQIMVRGDYSDVVRPWDHYIPINSDASDFEEVSLLLRDEPQMVRMIERCREAVLSVEGLRDSRRAAHLLETIGNMKTARRVHSSADKIESVVRRYQQEMKSKYVSLWVTQRLKGKAYRTLSKYPLMISAARKVQRLIRSVHI